MEKRNETIKRIALIRCDALGDLILTLPAIRSIRDTYPQAEIDLIVNNKFVPFVKSFNKTKYKNLIDNIIAHDTGNLLRTISEARKKAYDLAIDLTPASTKDSSIILIAARAKKKVGYAVGIRKFFLTTKVPPKKITYERDMVLEICKALDIPCKEDLFLPIRETGTRKQRTKRKQCIIHPGASSKEKMWEAEKFAELIREMHDADKGVSFALIGDKREEALCNQIIRASGMSIKEGLIENCAGSLSIEEVCQKIDEADLLICNNSGPMNIGAALNKPMVVLNLVSSKKRWAPKNQNTIFLEATNQDVEVEQAKKGNVSSRDISVEEAFNAVQTLLGKKEKRNRKKGKKEKKEKEEKKAEETVRNLLIINDLGIARNNGGTQKRILQLAQQLKKQNVFNKICVLAHENAKKEEIQGIQIFYTNSKDSKEKTKEIIMQENIDLVQVHNLSLLSTRCIDAAKNMRKKVIFFAHDYWPICARRSFYNHKKEQCSGPSIIKCTQCVGTIATANQWIKIKNAVNKCDVGIATSDFMVQRFEKHNLLKGKWKKVIPWIHRDFFKQQKKQKAKKERKQSKEKSILYVGTADHAKGFHDLLDAFAKTNLKTKGYRVNIVGSTTEETKESIERKYKEIQGSIVFKGYMQDQEMLKKEFQSTDVFVFPSLLEESFGQTWAQALAQGTLIVAYESGATKEFLSNNAYLVPMGNTQALAENMEKACEESNAQKRKKNREYAKMFSLDRAMPELRDMYDCVVK